MGRREDQRPDDPEAYVGAKDERVWFLQTGIDGYPPTSATSA
jgi:hypothetical protein